MCIRDRLNGNLRGKPTIIVSGRSDALVPVNNNSRAYTAYNRVVEGASTKLRYIEVTNGQHFDTFLPFSGFDTRFVPLHPYFNQAMDAMYAHLKSGSALPDFKWAYIASIAWLKYGCSGTKRVSNPLKGRKVSKCWPLVTSI